MKRYNLSEIMKRAHNLYNNARAKYPTFAEALKKSWKMAKFNAWVKKESVILEAENKIKAEKKSLECEEAAKRYEVWETEQKARKEAEKARVEAECNAYGYGCDNHYSAWSGWGNYCGD